MASYHAEENSSGGTKISTSKESEVFHRGALLHRLGGDEEFVTDVLEMYLNDAPSQIILLKESLIKKDLFQIRRQSHSLKGSSGTICANNMQNIALEMEKAADSNNLEKVSILLEKIENEFETLKEAINKQ